IPGANHGCNRLVLPCPHGPTGPRYDGNGRLRFRRKTLTQSAQKLREFGGKLELIWNKGLLGTIFPRAELESETPAKGGCHVQTDRKILCEERTTDCRRPSHM